MALYEMRTYSLYVGKMAEAVELYQTMAWPTLEAGGFDKYLVGYFMSDVGQLHQLVHLWKYEDDADRRAFWKRLYANDDFMAFATKLRPLIQTQQVQLLLKAPWGSHP